MTPEAGLVRRRRGRLTSAGLVAVGTALLMTVFEVVKTVVFPSLTLWESHVITILFASLAAAAAGYVVMSRIERTVTARVRGDIQEAEERFRRLSDGAFEGLAFVERGRIVDANARLGEMLGYDADELVGMDVWDFVAPEDRGLVEARIREGSTDRYEHAALRKDGSRFMVEVQGRPFRYRDRMVRATAISDITHRKAAEAALRESQVRYQELVDGVRDVIFAVSADGVLTDLNPAFEAATGWRPDEWLGRPVADLLHPADREQGIQALRTALAGEPRPTIQLRVRTKAGGYRIGEFRGNPQRADDRVVGLIGIVRDVTERFELEQQLRQAQKMEAVGRLAGGIAHDFNNLLLVIGMDCQLLLDDLPAGDERRHAAEEIARAGERAASLTRQLLAFSRRQVLAPREVDLDEVVAGVEDMLRRLLGEAITLVVRPAGDLATVRADVGQVEQVLMNLAANARDAMPSGGTLTVETANVAVTGTGRGAEDEPPPGCYVVLRVTDTGIGMDAETQSQVFEPFFTTKPRGQGTGLGLSTAYGIIRQSDGYVTLRSVPEKGATFAIYLPALPGPRGEDDE